MNASVNRQILLVEKPGGKLGPEHFRLVDGAVPEPKEGEVLLHTRLISLDAANRAWMHGATYRSAVEANSVMAGGSISEVVSSKAQGFAPGDLVFADTGWQDFAALPATQLTKMPKVEPIRTIDYPTPARRPSYSVLDKTLTWQALGLVAPHWRVPLWRTLEPKTAVFTLAEGHKP